MPFVNLPFPTAISPDRTTSPAPAIDQFAPRALALPDDRFLVTWLDERDGALHLQLVTAGGRATLDAFRVAAPPGHELSDAYSLATAPDGSVWIAAQSTIVATGTTQVVVTRLDLDDLTGVDSAPVWYLVDRGATGAQVFPSVAVQPDGRAVVTWIEIPAGQSPEAASLTLSGNVRATILTAPETTVTGAFSVNNLSFGAGLFGTDIAVRDDGSFVVVWDGGQIGTGGQISDIIAQRFAPNGTKLGEPFVLNNVTTGIQFGGRIELLDNGDWVAVWQTPSVLPNGMTDIKARLFAPDGTARGAEFLVHENWVGVQRAPDVTVLPGNRFMVSWTDESGVLNDPGTGIAARIFNFNGNAHLVGEEGAEGPSFPLNDRIVGIQDDARLAVAGNRLLTVWQDEDTSGAVGTGADVAWRVFDVEPGKTNIVTHGPPAEAVAAGLVGSRLVDTVVFPDGTIVHARIEGFFTETGSFRNALVVTIQENGDVPPRQISLTEYGSPSGPQLFPLTDVRNAFPMPDGQVLLKLGFGFVLIDTISGTAAALPYLPGGDAEFLTPNYTILLFRAVNANYADSSGLVRDRSVVEISEYFLDGVQIGDVARSNLTYFRPDIFIAPAQDGFFLTTVELFFRQQYSTDRFLFKPVLEGSGAADTLLGADRNEEIFGFAGNDLIRGRTGHDTIHGGAGSDTILGGTGHDDLYGGDGPDRLSGEAGDDLLSGGSGDDTLDGGIGADVMSGGSGSDTFRVDHLGDRVIESRTGSGVDTVIASVDFRMGRAHVENLELTGTGDIRGIGNGLTNRIEGNGGDNILDGGKNNDTLIGGPGNDRYFIRAPGDTAVELAGGGIDTVMAFRSYALEAHVEQLFMQNVLTRAGAPALLNGIGNALDNAIVGTPYANVLVGREGRDTLRGQAGADTFVFDRAPGPSNIDRIIDFNTNAADEGDILKLKGAVFGGLPAGMLDAAAFVAGTGPRDAGDRFVFDRPSGQLWFDADGTGAASRVLVATFERNALVTAADIEIF